ncbi:MAG TPA: hypothetical protein VK659_07730 [Asanoa sp.]|nr:hypothetical protein [Asanoa sp.]
MRSDLDDSVLDDPSRLSVLDSDGLLHAAARAGAQVRATVEAARDSELARLAGATPRALVLITPPGLGPAVTRLMIALLGRACPVPVVASDTAPTWLGPLDVVVAHTDDPGDVELAESIDRACRYGAGVVLTAPEDGPVAAAAAGRAVLIPPRVPVPPGFGFARALTGALLTATTLDLLRTDLSALADELDREAERDHVQHESFVNPAKTLALRLADRTPLLWGVDDVAAGVACHAAQMLATHTALVCDIADYAQAASRSALLRAATNASSGQDIFADPDDLDPAQSSPLRVFLLAVRAAATDPVWRLAVDSFPAADVLALRFELAALYLGLASGTTGGSSRYAPARSRE